MHVRHPLWLRKASEPGAEAFAILFTLECFARATVTAVIPLDALHYLGDASAVSSLYFFSGLVGILFGFFVPIFIGWTARRWVYTGGVLSVGLASVLMAIEGLESQVAGMMLRVAGVVTMAICLNLYLLDHIAKKDLNKSEPKRILYSAVAWTVGPGIGTFLYAEVSPVAAYGIGVVFAVAALVYFWFLRLSDGTVIKAGKVEAPNPLKNINRFLQQPRLVLAWLLAAGKCAWWAMLFIYAPILAVQTGLGQVAGGMIVSVACGILFLMPLWAKYQRACGMRRVLSVGFFGSALATALVAATMDWPLLAAGLLILGAGFMVTMDAVGNMTFMLAVHPNERPAMTSVYSTYRDAAEITVPGLFSVILRQFELAAVFVVTGLMMVGMASLSRTIHPRLGRDRAHDPKFRDIPAS